MGLDDLLDELLEPGAVLLALEHLPVDGDLCVQGLLGVQEHLQLDHEGLALLAHLPDLAVAVVEGGLVASLVVLQLVVEFLDLLLQQGVASLQVGQFSSKVAELGAETFDLLLGISLLHALAGRLGLDLLDFEAVPGLHVVAVDVGQLVVFVADVADGRGELVLEEFAVLGGRVARSQGLKEDCYWQREMFYLELLDLVVVDTPDEVDLLQEGLDLVLVVDAVQGLLVEVGAGPLELAE